MVAAGQLRPSRMSTPQLRRDEARIEPKNEFRGD